MSKLERTNKLIVYFTPDESVQLESAADYLKESKAQFVANSTLYEISRLLEVPREVIDKKIQQITTATCDTVKGHICSNGHAFYIEYECTSPPIACPCCGNMIISPIWAGTITKGVEWAFE